ncbi:MAG: metallophosphoesterase [Propionibacteriaceae bacterium]|jgi:predicted MPP superfamily phosphohydrolase|nr:metallophosphoesterase [Propionibacteriaceae bacterium]
MPTPRSARAVATGLAAAGLAGLTWGVAVERHWFALRRLVLPLLPAGAEPVTVLHLSDLHLTPGQDRKVAWLRRLGDLRPDLVVSTGDNVAQAEALPALAHALEPLLDRPGGFVFGSNDLYSARWTSPHRYLGGTTSGSRRQHQRLPTTALRALLSGGGWSFLEGRRVVVELNGSRIELRGCGDAHLGLDTNYAAVAGPPDPTVDLALGVAHAPYRRVLDAMTADGVGLILAGHTHGGQVCLPGYGALTTNSDLDRRQAKGLSSHRWAGRQSQLHVSAGLGTSPFAPYRFACRPEASLLALVPSDALG